MRLVVVGCGGIACQAATMLRQMLASAHAVGEPVSVTLVDPDMLEERNTARQWAEGAENSPKVEVMAEALQMVPMKMETIQRLWADVPEVEGATGEHTVVMVWPDNDACRAEVVKDFSPGGRFHRPWVTLVTAGNDAEDAVAYGMKIGEADALNVDGPAEVLWPMTRDFTKTEAAPAPGCNHQTWLANAKAAFLSMMLLDYMQERWLPGDPPVELATAGVKVLKREIKPAPEEVPIVAVAPAGPRRTASEKEPMIDDSPAEQDAPGAWVAAAPKTRAVIVSPETGDLMEPTDAEMAVIMERMCEMGGEG